MKKLTSLLLAVLLLAMAIPSMAEEPVHLRIATWTSNEDQLKLLGSFVDDSPRPRALPSSRNSSRCRARNTAACC